MAKAPKFLKTLNNPPALAINAKLYGTDKSKGQLGITLIPRVRLEQRIAWNLFQHISLAGFEPYHVDDGSGEVTKTKTWKHVMEVIFNLDDAYVFVRHATMRKVGDGPHYIRFVFGNDGVDCISDWGYAHDDYDGFNATMDKFDAEVYA